MRAFLVAMLLALFALVGANARAHLQAAATDTVRSGRVVHAAAEPFRTPRPHVVVRDVHTLVEERRGAERPLVANDTRDGLAFAARRPVVRPPCDATPRQWRGTIEPPPPRA